MWDAIVIGSYIGGVGPQPGPTGQFGRLLAWLSNGELRFAEAGNPYDIVHLGEASFGIRAPLHGAEAPEATGVVARQSRSACYFCGRVCA